MNEQELKNLLQHIESTLVNIRHDIERNVLVVSYTVQEEERTNITGFWLSELSHSIGWVQNARAALEERGIQDE